MMRGLRAVARAEVARVFRDPLAWWVLALGEGLMALSFLLFVVRYIDHQADLSSNGVTIEIMLRYFGVASISILLVTPLLTMGTLAGDRRDGMLRFFFSTPLSSSAIVGGKLLGVLCLSGTYLLLVVLMPLTLLWGAPIDLGVYAANVLGLVLFATMHVALGLLASALTRAPMASALIALSASLVLWSIDWAARLDPDGVSIGGWSTLTRLRGFAQGLLISADLIYFVVATSCCLFITVLVIDADRRLT